VLVEEQERESAARVFQEVSRLLDKRLYRMRLIYWALVRQLKAGEESSAADDQWADYKTVLREWNDSINRNLALIQQYFGADMRESFDYSIGALIVEIGQRLESIHTDPASMSQAELPHLTHRLDEVGLLIYQFNLEMIRALQAGKVGWLVAENAEDVASK
jgi:hypothetical protein